MAIVIRGRNLMRYCAFFQQQREKKKIEGYTVLHSAGHHTLCHLSLLMGKYGQEPGIC